VGGGMEIARKLKVVGCRVACQRHWRAGGWRGGG
jgi:hypothetical protein